MYEIFDEDICKLVCHQCHKNGYTMNIDKYINPQIFHSGLGPGRVASTAAAAAAAAATDAEGGGR